MANPGPASSNFANAQPLNSSQAIRLLAVLRAVNMNLAGDVLLPIVASGVFSVANVIFTNASISLTAAAAGIFTLPSAGGTAIVANAALTALTTSSVVSQRTVATTAAQSSTPNLYFNIATAQGAAATADVFVYGYDLT